MQRLSRISSGAAQWAALLFAACFALTGPLAVPAGAKMRVDRLWVVTASGKETPIEVEIAEEPKEKALGLMFRTELPEGTGMLFPYDRPQEVTMWMRNTYIPLDMVFIRGDGVVHRIEAHTQPMSEEIIASQGPVTAVLELPAGAAAKLGLQPGDQVRHPRFGKKKP